MQENLLILQHFALYQLDDRGARRKRRVMLAAQNLNGLRGIGFGRQ